MVQKYESKATKNNETKVEAKDDSKTKTKNENEVEAKDKDKQPLSPGATYNSPGPIYSLPGLTGQQMHDPRSYHSQGPAYSLGSRGKKDMVDSSPGPVYNPNSKLVRTGIAHVPRPTIVSRPKDQTTFITPGPCLGIDPEDKSKGPAYSFGHRGKAHILSDSPGPSAYMLPRTLGRTVESDKRQAPSHSVKSRMKPAQIDYSPGPGTYKVPECKQYTAAAPSHSVKGRHKDFMDTNCSPGPAGHYPSNYTRKNAPKFSFGSKHSPYSVPLIVPA